MRYKISPILLIFVLSIQFLSLEALSQRLDSIYKVPNSPFISQLLSFKSLNASINLSELTKQIPIKDSIIVRNAQHLIKEGDDIFIFIEQTGFVFKLTQLTPDSLVYKRMDRTVNINYNIDCFNFIYKNNLYSYGGYGFWKTNGTLRTFNKQDKEWDVLPLNKEIIATAYLWFSPKEGRVYLPLQRIVNAGIAGPENVKGVPDYTSYYLDLNKLEWVKLGSLENGVKEIVKDDFRSAEFISYENGFLHRVNEETFLFDFIHNKVYKSKNSNLNQFLIRRSYNENMFIQADKIYSYDAATKTFISFPFTLSDFVLLDTKIWGWDTIYYTVLWIILIIALAFVLSIWIFRKMVNRKLQIEQIKMLKNKTVNQVFTGTESALLELLINTTLKQDNVEIHQINHVLGIKDKNIGLQKKVRSDVIKAINEKYEFITQSSYPVIASSRKAEDKRFFEYFITPSELNAIRRILEKN